MNAVRFALAGILVLGLTLVAQAGDKDKAKDKDDKKDAVKVVGTWEVEKGKGLPKGAKIQFTKDGKVVITATVEDKEHKIEGTYKLDGKTIKMTTKRGDKDRTQDIKIKEASDKQLVLEGPKGETLTLKKVGATKKEKEKKDK